MQTEIIWDIIFKTKPSHFYISSLTDSNVYLLLHLLSPVIVCSYLLSAKMILVKCLHKFQKSYKLFIQSQVCSSHFNSSGFLIHKLRCRVDILQKHDELKNISPHDTCTHFWFCIYLHILCFMHLKIFFTRVEFYLLWHKCAHNFTVMWNSFY